MKRIAVYPGTFDPITNGHIDLLKRAAALFDEVIVAVAADPGRSVCFSVAERTQLIEAVLAPFDVLVKPFEGLLVHFMREVGAQVMIRGIRAVSDFDYEFQMASMNRTMASGLETVFLTPADQYANISSTMVREIAKLGGDVSPFVDPFVKEALNRRFRWH